MRKLNYSSFTLFFLLYIGSYSCDNTFEPLDKENGIYSIYGSLDLNKEKNYIRIRDLNVPFTLEDTEFIDAEVMLKHVDSENDYILNSKREEYDGVYLHNFLFEKKIVPDNTYQLTVTHSNGLFEEITIQTPTKPSPQIAPINQNCFVPVNFKLEPLYESTVVLQLGIISGSEDGYLWGSRYIFKPDSSQSDRTINFTFIPKIELFDIIFRLSPDRKCSEILRTQQLFLNYTHYGAGFYEEVFEQEFNVRDTQQFGPLYYDTLAIPIDTSRVCPQECE